jgi:hypothetical protein
MRLRPVVVVGLVGLWLLVAAGIFAAPATADTIDVEHTLGQSPEVGAVDAETRLRVPEGTATLELTLPQGTDVYETRGFRRAGERTYEWTGTTTRPYLRYSMEGNVTIDRGQGEDYLYAVTDEWAVVRTPTVRLEWTGIRADVNVSASADGEGVAGRYITYLGPNDEYTRQASDQRFRLVLADAADLREDREAVLDTFEYTADRLEIGKPDEEVLVIVVPSANIRWAATGVQRGDADMWVRDRERLSNPKNTWVHEYVHTLQNYDRTEATRWTIEGMADYYAALISYERGHIDYETFRDRMEDGRDEDVSDVRLVDPATWVSNQGNYDRGALVFGHLDRRIRKQSDASLDAVVDEFNADSENLTQERFLEAVEAVGGTTARSDARRYTETTDAPPVWGRHEHVDTFGGPEFHYAFDGFAVSGPYREGPVDGPRLVVGERLQATVRVENVGTQKGEFDAALRVDGESVVSESGMLAPAESTTVTLGHEFGAPGEYGLAVGSASTTAVVEPPAGVEVTGLEAVPRSAARGERVRLRATVESTADRPAAGEVTFAVDGEAIATGSVRMAAGTSTVETTTTFDRPGEYDVSAGDNSTTVTVRDETLTPTPAGANGTPTLGDGPAPSPAAALAALATGALLYRRR